MIIVGIIGKIKFGPNTVQNFMNEIFCVFHYDRLLLYLVVQKRKSYAKPFFLPIYRRPHATAQP